MNTIRRFPGDTLLVGDAELQVDRPVSVRSSGVLKRMPAPGLTDLPETTLRVQDLWPRFGHRVPMTTRQDLRCPCGSVYIRRSATHHSCQSCRRVWANEQVEEVEQSGKVETNLIS